MDNTNSENKPNKVSIGSFVAGQVAILSYIILPPGIPFLISILAVVLGSIAIEQIKKKNEEGKKFAVLGICFGAGSIVFNILLRLFFII